MADPAARPQLQDLGIDEGDPNAVEAGRNVAAKTSSASAPGSVDEQFTLNLRAAMEVGDKKNNFCFMILTTFFPLYRR